MEKAIAAVLAPPLMVALTMACGSSVYSPGLPGAGAGAGGSDASAGQDGAALPVSTIDSGLSPTGECVGKSCPIPLVAGLMVGSANYAVTGVAVDGSNVFVGARPPGQTGCLIGRVPKLGGNLETVFLGAGDECYAIAAAAGTVYVAGAVNTTPGPGFNGISSVPAAGGTPAPVQAMNASRSIAVGDTVYVVQHVSSSTISRLSTTGGSPQLIHDARPETIGVAVSGSRLFWLEKEDPNTAYRFPTRLARSTTSPGVVTYIVGGIKYRAALAANATEVFWTSFNWPNCTIGRAPVDGGSLGAISIPCTAFGITPDDFGTAQYPAPSLAADATDLILGIHSRVYRVPL